WSARWGALPGLRAALGLPEGTPTPSTPPTPAPPPTPPTPSATSVRLETDHYERIARELIEAIAATNWDATCAPEVAARILTPAFAAGTPDLSAVSGAITPGTADKARNQVTRVLEFACTELVPRLNATAGEIDAVLHALDGGYVPAGPSGSPTRGLVNVLPTGRNFYSVDPKAIPSRTSF